MEVISKGDEVEEDADHMDKVHIEKNTVQETLIIPLYARKLCSEQYPAYFRDEKAVELIERLDYDFSQIEKKSRSLMQRFGALEVAMRQCGLAIETGVSERTSKGGCGKPGLRLGSNGGKLR